MFNYKDFTINIIIKHKQFTVTFSKWLKEI